jgi:hypothetical protein
MPRGPLVSRFHQSSQFASQFRDSVGALNLLRDFTTRSVPSVCFAILRLRWRSKFTSRFRRFRVSVGAFNSLRNVTTPPTFFIRFAFARLRRWSQFASRRRRSQFASRCRDSSNRVERSFCFKIPSAHYSLREIATPSARLIYFATSRLSRRSQFAALLIRFTISRRRRCSQFALRFRDSVGAINLFRDFATPSTPSIPFAISRFPQRFQFASRIRDSVDALNWFEISRFLQHQQPRSCYCSTSGALEVTLEVTSEGTGSYPLR